MKISVVLTFVIVFIFSCKDNKKNEQLVQKSVCQPIDLTVAVEDDVVDWSQPDITYHMTEGIDEVKILPLESSKEESLIAGIEGLFFINDRIIVFDEWDLKYQTKIFDKDGKFINSIHQGHGPGEVEKIYCMTVDYKNNQILMYHPSGILYTDLEGKFIKDDRVNYGFIEMATMDDKLVFKVDDYQVNKYLSDNYKEHYGKALLVTDKEYKPLYSAIPLLGVDFSIVTPSVTKTSNGLIAFTKELNDTIYYYDGDIAYPKYNLIYPNKAFDEIPEQTEEIDMLEQTNDGFYHPGWYFETEKTQSFRLFDQKNIIMINVFRDRESGNIIWEKDTRRNGLNSMNTFAIVPKTTYGDYFVTDLDYSFKQQHLKCLRPFLTPEDLKKVENMTEDDNPMLILYKFKKF